MGNSLQLSHNKTMKLTNVVSKEIFENELEQLELVVMKMENYIKSKGSQPIGPLIQHTITEMSADGNVTVKMQLLRQSSNFINQKNDEYKIESLIRVPNCMYCRYIGPEQYLKFAYDKINLAAFEEDIRLKGDSYTIFVNRNENEGAITADVFMERDD